MKTLVATAALAAVSIPTFSGTAEARGFGIPGDWGGHHGGGVSAGLRTVGGLNLSRHHWS